MRSSSLPQQMEAAFTNISVASDDFVSSVPGGTFSAVAFKFPNPTPRLPRSMFFWLVESTLFSRSTLFNNWF